MQEKALPDMPNDPSRRAQASALPPDVAALIDAAMARQAGSTTRRRPVVPFRTQALQDTPWSLPRLNVSKRRARVLALEDLVLIGLFVGLLLAAWVSLLIGINMAEAAERTTRTCIVRAEAPAANPSALDHSSCARLAPRA